MFFPIDVSEQLSQALANISLGVCHPLKIRVEKILTVPVPSTTLYAVTNLIRFYKNSISQVNTIFYTFSGKFFCFPRENIQNFFTKSLLADVRDRTQDICIKIQAPNYLAIIFYRLIEDKDSYLPFSLACI